MTNTGTNNTQPWKEFEKEVDNFQENTITQFRLGYLEGVRDALESLILMDKSMAYDSACRMVEEKFAGGE